MENPIARAKVKCTEKTESEWGTNAEPKRVFTYKFSFAGGHESEENKNFWAASPSGQLSLSAIREDLYVIGQWYYLDWTPALA